MQRLQGLLYSTAATVEAGMLSTMTSLAFPAWASVMAASQSRHDVTSCATRFIACIAGIAAGAKRANTRVMT